MSGFTILVSGLAPETTESKLQDFFSFCGKTISVTKTEKSATIVFERESAAKTALMLNGGTLDGAHLEVSSTTTPLTTTASAIASNIASSAQSTLASASESIGSALPSSANEGTPIGADLGNGVTAQGHADGEVRQEDKPRAAIVAEYLAFGYILSDNIIDRFLEMDRSQGISSRFMNFMHRMDQEVGTRVAGPDATASHVVAAPVTQYIGRAQEFDKQKGISDRFIRSYSKARDTPIGQKIFKFYTDVTKEVLDVHEEARRITNEKKATQDRIAAEQATAARVNDPPTGSYEAINSVSATAAAQPTSAQTPTTVVGI